MQSNNPNSGTVTIGQNRSNSNANSSNNNSRVGNSNSGSGVSSLSRTYNELHIQPGENIAQTDDFTHTFNQQRNVPLMSPDESHA